MKTLISGAPKVQLSDYIKTNGLNQIMQDTLLDYLLSLHVSELSKEQYLCRLRKFGLWLSENGLKSFIDAEKAHINRFLAMYSKNNTKNGYMTTLIPFYRDFLNKTEVIKGLNYYNEDSILFIPYFELARLQYGDVDLETVEVYKNGELDSTAPSGSLIYPWMVIPAHTTGNLTITLHTQP